MATQKYKTLDHTTEKTATCVKSTFDEEMEEKGIASEIKDLGRFNYVLVTRSSPTHQESFSHELAEKMSSGTKSHGNLRLFNTTAAAATAIQHQEKTN